VVVVVVVVVVVCLKQLDKKLYVSSDIRTDEARDLL